MAKAEVILGMDIGSTRITTVVGEVRGSRGLVLRGISSVPTQAILRGTVRDLNQAAEDIDGSYAGAMYSSGVVSDEVFVGITGRDLHSRNTSASLAVLNEDGEVTHANVQKVVDDSMPRDLEPGEQIVHSMVREFVLDGIRINRSPRGMIGQELEAESHVVIGAANQIANLERALKKVGLQVKSYVFNLIAAGEAVLSEEDRSAGCVLIDFGGGTTNVGVFLGGSLSYSKCIPIGGENYDRDLKQGLGVSLEEAQRVKKSYGRAWLDDDSDELEDFIDVKFYGRREYDKVKRRKVYEIMQPRTEELLENIIDALNDSGQLSKVAGSVVIVGGACQLRQLRRYLQRHLQRQVRVGIPFGIGHLLDEYRNPAYAAPLGLLIYGAKFRDDNGKDEGNFAKEVFQEMVTTIRSMFNRTSGKN